MIKSTGAVFIFLTYSSLTHAASSIELYGSMQIAYEAQSKYLDLLDNGGLQRLWKAQRAERNRLSSSGVIADLDAVVAAARKLNDDFQIDEQRGDIQKLIDAIKNINISQAIENGGKGVSQSSIDALIDAAKAIDKDSIWTSEDKDDLKNLIDAAKKIKLNHFIETERKALKHVLALERMVKFKQKSEGDSYVGIKIKEDLGLQTSAFAQLEMGFSANNGTLYTGSRDNGGITPKYNHNKSLVGLRFQNDMGQHQLYFGRSNTPFDRLDNSVGKLHAKFDSDMNQTLLGGLWSNGAFYDFNSKNIQFMAARTTRAGVMGNTYEGSQHPKRKASFGLAARYTAPNGSLGAGWQKQYFSADEIWGILDDLRDSKLIKLTGLGDTLVPPLLNNEWKVTGSYSWRNLTLNGSFAQGKISYSPKIYLNHHTAQASLAVNLTPFDTLFANYGVQKFKTFTYKNSNAKLKIDKLGLGYVHHFGRHTQIFTNVMVERAQGKLMIKNKTYAHFNRIFGAATDIGLSHQF